MEALYIQPRTVGGVMMEEEAKSVEQEPLDTSSPTSSTDEDDEDLEPQPPPVIRRKVSFADAFGLNLVSVKEFHNIEASEPEISVPSDRGEEAISSDDFYMCCLFTVPPTPEELEHKLQEQMIELESIELLPRTTTLRGIVRVVNLCYSKLVYVRITLDRWRSHFDILAEYVPGSSDRKTDRFTFQYTLVPPFEKEGTRVEFCLRYETSVGTFWANNKQINYVLFCHQKVKDYGPQLQEENNNYKSKRSCLKANRRESAEEIIRDIINGATYATESKGTCQAKVTDQLSAHKAGTQLSHSEEHKHTVDSIKSRHRAARLARTQDHCPQRKQTVPQAYSHDLPRSQKGSPPISSVECNSSCFLHNSNKAQTNSSSQYPTYHQIPPLDWSSDKAQQGGGVDELWTERAKITSSKSPEESVTDTASVTNMRETFLNGTEKNTTKESAVFDVWQAFLNGSDCATHSGVPESQWLQTATLVSPSNNNEDPSVQCGAIRQVQGFHVGKDIPNLDSSNPCQVASDTCETSLANVALNTEDQQLAKAAAACVRSSPRDDNMATPQDAPQRSETNSATETAREFSLVGATPVSKGYVDSPGECHKHEIWERKGKGIIGGIGSTGGDEPFTMHNDLVTSSGESQTTDMTAMPEFPNASGVDTISQGARQPHHEGLPYSGDGKVTGSAYNAMDDTLAFKETIRQGTRDGERFVSSTCRQGGEEEEGLTTNCAGNKEAKKEEIVETQEIEKCQGSQGGEEGGEQWQDIYSLKKFEQIENTVASNGDGLMDENHYMLNMSMDKNIYLERNKNDDASSHKPKTDKEKEIIKELNEDAWSHKDTNSDNLLARNCENIAIFPDINIRQLKPLAAVEKLNDKDDIEEPNPFQNQIETKVTGDKVVQSEQDCCKIMREILKPCKEIPPSVVTKEDPFPHTARTLATKKVFQSDTSSWSLFPTDEYKPEVVEISWTHSHNDIKGRKEDVPGSRVDLEELVLKENVVKKELQPETLEGIEEEISQTDKDERVRIGKLKIEAMVGESMGNIIEHPRGESKNAAEKLKEQELSAEVESSPPHVEYQKMSERTKNPIRPDGTATLGEMGSKEMFLERFGQELVRRVWKEVFDQQYNIQAASTNTIVIDRIEDPQEDSKRDGCHLVRPITSNQKCTQTLTDTGGFSMNCNEGGSLDKTEEIHFAPNSDVSTHPDNDQNYTLRSQSSPSTYEPTQSSTIGQELTERKYKILTLQKIDSKEVDCAVADREDFNRSPQKHRSASDRKFKDGATWRNIFYALFHITRLLICVVLVAGFFLIFFFYDFPTFVVLYSFSMCCWIYKWRRYQLIEKQRDNEKDSS